MQASLALAVPVAAGLIWMALTGAPQVYLLVNAGALVLALAAARWLPFDLSESKSVGLGVVLIALLMVTAIFGVEIDGVRRWLALGPLKLHIGYLVLPLLVVLTARVRSPIAAGLLIAALAICALQPDRATVLALSAVAIARVAMVRDRFAMVALIAATVALAVVWSFPDPLAPVRYVERVLQDAWAQSPAAGAALLLASLAPVILLRSQGRAALPLVAFVLAAGIASLIGPYPSVLIGFGAAPIIGLGLALAALRQQ